MAALVHTRSHVDAPLHVVADGRAIEDLTLDELCGDAVVIDVHDVHEREAVGSEFTSEDFVVHRALLGRDIPIVEQATGLGEVGPGPFVLRAAFVRLAGLEAAPCRIYAELPDR